MCRRAGGAGAQLAHRGHRLLRPPARALPSRHARREGERRALRARVGAVRVGAPGRARRALPAALAARRGLHPHHMQARRSGLIRIRSGAVAARAAAAAAPGAGDAGAPARLLRARARGRARPRGRRGGRCGRGRQGRRRGQRQRARRLQWRRRRRLRGQRCRRWGIRAGQRGSAGSGRACIAGEAAIASRPRQRYRWAAQRRRGGGHAVHEAAARRPGRAARGPAGAGGQQHQLDARRGFWHAAGRRPPVRSPGARLAARSSACEHSHLGVL